MRALIWIVEDTWEATVAEAAAYLPADAEVTLLHVAPEDVETLAAGARHGLLGRPRHGGPGAPAAPARHGLLGRPRHHPPHGPPAPAPLRAISEEGAAQLLEE